MDAKKRQALSASLNEIHEQLALIRKYVEAEDDPSALDLVTLMDHGALAPMSKLRKKLGIPHNCTRPKDWK
jgi:hypothetical protein